ncbi:MAG: 3-oxoacyl-ACP reductase FabG [Oscillospiraceae bacterium]|nr:3-oxoacyl-ACP reductase FabG [Oscillospiraceae bacterium]
MKTAIVTGGSGGIGSAICRMLAENNYFVYVNYSSSKEKAIKLAEEIHGSAIKFDISDREQVNNAINSIGQVDLLINNAGISEINTFDSVSPEKADRILNINLKGTLNCSRAVIPDMIHRKSGVIINISSIWGQCGASCEVDYSASKAGVIGFTKALAKELAPSGIRINCIAPGFIMTDMNSNFSESDLQLIKNDIPLGIFGTPQDIANAVMFFASEKSSFITGQILGVNGGMNI